MSNPAPMPSYWALAEEVTHLHGHLDKLQAENAKLRELVRDFYPFALGHAAKPWLAVRRDRMRELGVEV